MGGLIILAIVLFSVLLNFLMEFQARHAVEDIQQQIALTAAVIRDGKEQELPTAELVPGDIVRLNAGDPMPADARLLDVKDLHVRESADRRILPVEKTAVDLPRRNMPFRTPAIAFSWALRYRPGSAVRSLCTGRDTACGEIANRLAMRPPETEFARGIRHFGIIFTRITIVLVLFVMLVNIIFHRPLLESFLFFVALAVGMTPEMMPMIITVTLSQGARRMTKKEAPCQTTSGNRGFWQCRHIMH